MTFTDRELNLLSDGLLVLLDNAGQAKRLVRDTDTHRAISEYMKELQALNIKVCRAE